MKNMPIRMRTRLLKKLLAVQTLSSNEDRMVAFLTAHCRAAGYDVSVDESKNVWVTKGKAAFYPGIGAHIDTVHHILDHDIDVAREGKLFDRYVGYRSRTDVRWGIGADCKTGVFVCLELLRIMPVLKVVFFAMEEIGCQGARHISRNVFDDIGYFIEFDCPSKNMMSYTSSGVRLFDNDGPFIEAILPVLQAYGVKWQHHPYTDVSVIAPRFGLACLNMASGYYHWHSDREFAYLPDIRNAIEMGEKLISALGIDIRYALVGSNASPAVAVTGLIVPDV